LMRSHTDTVLHMSQDVFRRHMATVSADHTIRVWSQDTGEQVLSLPLYPMTLRHQFLSPCLMK